MAATANFSFKAVDPTGLPHKGILKGESKEAVLDELKGRGLTVTDVTEKSSGLKIEIKLLPKRVKAADLPIMTRQPARQAPRAPGAPRHREKQPPQNPDQAAAEARQGRRPDDHDPPAGHHGVGGHDP